MRAGILTITDFNPGDKFDFSEQIMSAPNRIGDYQTFDGSRSGKFIPRQLRLNPVRIAKFHGQAHAVSLKTTPDNPVWGSRSWVGELGPILFDLSHPLEPELPGNHEMRVDLRDAALQKAYSNISKADFDAQLFIGELAETVAMLRDPFKAFKKFGRLRTVGQMYDTMTGKVRYVPSRLRAATDLTADTYLQMVFGGAPLVQEVLKAYQAYKTLIVRSNFLRARGKRKGLINEYEILRTAPVLKSSSMTWGIHLKTEHSTYARIYFAPTWDERLHEMVRKWGFNPLELPITAWRLYPLSFVFDWFLSVSDWLSAIRPRPEVRILGNCVSEVLRETWDVNLKSIRLSKPWEPRTLDPDVSGIKLPIYSYNYERLIRVVNLPPPVGIHWGNGIDSIGKMISATMLTWQKLSASQYENLKIIASRRA